jgi:hypothetical protein
MYTLPALDAGLGRVLRGAGSTGAAGRRVSFAGETEQGASQLVPTAFFAEW